MTFFVELSQDIIQREISLLSLLKKIDAVAAFRLLEPFHP